MVEFYICMQLFEFINFEISGSGERGIGGGSTLHPHPPATWPDALDPRMTT